MLIFATDGKARLTIGDIVVDRLPDAGKPSKHGKAGGVDWHVNGRRGRERQCYSPRGGRKD